MKSCWMPACHIQPLFKDLILLCGAQEEGMPEWGCQQLWGLLVPGSALLISKCRSPALHVFHMRHDSPLLPKRVWFSQKWEDLAGQHKKIKELVTDYFPPSVLTDRVGNIPSVLLKGTRIILKLKGLSPVNQRDHIQTSVSYTRFWI